MVARTKKTRTKKKHAAPRKGKGKRRASWKGNMTFGLVSFGVEAFNAINREGSDIHFHQLHAKCHSRIHYEKVCPIHGPVPNDEIVSGYEISKGRYIEIDPEELDAVRTQHERALKIDAFVSPETIDPLYFDGRMYYLLPADGTAEEPYAVVTAAMEREERYGVGQVVFSGKDQVVLVRPMEGVLHMAMLNYEAEIRQPETIARGLRGVSGLTKQVAWRKRSSANGRTRTSTSRSTKTPTATVSRSSSTPKRRGTSWSRPRKRKKRKPSASWTP